MNDDRHIVKLDNHHGSESVALTGEEFASYAKSPEAYAANHYGLTISEYREWLREYGAVRCSARLLQQRHSCKSS